MLRARCCSHCGDAIPFKGRIDRKYCRASCRTLAYRHRRDGRPRGRGQPAGVTTPSALVELVVRLEERESAARRELSEVRARNAELEDSLQRYQARERENKYPGDHAGSGRRIDSEPQLRPAEARSSSQQEQIAELVRQVEQARKGELAAQQRSAQLEAELKQFQGHWEAQPAKTRLDTQSLPPAGHPARTSSSARLTPPPFRGDEIFEDDKNVDHRMLSLAYRVLDEDLYEVMRRRQPDRPDLLDKLSKVLGAQKTGFKIVCRFIVWQLRVEIGVGLSMPDIRQFCDHHLSALRENLRIEAQASSIKVDQWFAVHRSTLRVLAYAITYKVLAAFGSSIQRKEILENHSVSKRRANELYEERAEETVVEDDLADSETEGSAEDEQGENEDDLNGEVEGYHHSEDESDQSDEGKDGDGEHGDGEDENVDDDVDVDDEEYEDEDEDEDED